MAPTFVTVTLTDAEFEKMQPGTWKRDGLHRELAGILRCPRCGLWLNLSLSKETGKIYRPHPLGFHGWGCVEMFELKEEEETDESVRVHRDP